MSKRNRKSTEASFESIVDLWLSKIPEPVSDPKKPQQKKRYREMNLEEKANKISTIRNKLPDLMQDAVDAEKEEVIMLKLSQNVHKVTTEAEKALSKVYILHETGVKNDIYLTEKSKEALLERIADSKQTNEFMMFLAAAFSKDAIEHHQKLLTEKIDKKNHVIKKINYFTTNPDAYLTKFC